MYYRVFTDLRNFFVEASNLFEALKVFRQHFPNSSCSVWKVQHVKRVPANRFCFEDVTSLDKLDLPISNFYVRSDTKCDFCNSAIHDCSLCSVHDTDSDNPVC